MSNIETNKFISLIYVLLATFLILIVGGFYILPIYSNQGNMSSENLLSDAISNERYVSTDQISDKIISGDPSFKLVDVRDEDSYNDYSLPNSINIPLPKLLNEKFEKQLNQDQFDIIFYSNDNIYADQAWIICKQLGYNNLFVLKGGLNEWFETIINPGLPKENMPEQDFIQYSQRKAASIFFGVKYPEPILPIMKKVVTAPPKEVVTVKKKKKRPVEGGC